VQWPKEGEKMPKLAINGGSKVRTREFFPWPYYDHRDLKFVEELIKSRVMLKAAEKHDFLTMRTVEVCKKSHFNSSFKANILDFGR